MDICFNIDPGSETRSQIDEMKSHFGVETDDQLCELVLAHAHAVVSAEQNGGCLVLTPEGGAPLPISLDEFTKIKPHIVK